MEDIKHEHNHAKYEPKYWAKWHEDLTGLTALVHWFHGRDIMVYDNLRSTNIIVPTTNPEKITFVDFDWGGEAGKVPFSTWMINEDLIGECGLESLAITKEHDNRVLPTTLERSGPENMAIAMDTS